MQSDGGRSLCELLAANFWRSRQARRFSSYDRKFPHVKCIGPVRIEQLR